MTQCITLHTYWDAENKQSFAQMFRLNYGKKIGEVRFIGPSIYVAKDSDGKSYIHTLIASISLNHYAYTPAVHEKSFHKCLTKPS